MDNDKLTVEQFRSFLSALNSGAWDSDATIRAKLTVYCNKLSLAYEGLEPLPVPVIRPEQREG